jgi:uracil-DNA glycosylase
MITEERIAAMRALGARLDGRDLEVYSECGLDPDEPITGEGDPRARLCILGRDPGREEIRHRAPFAGAGGQKVRGSLHRALYGRPCPDFAASLEVGRTVFWANMVPYKPLGNKAWRPAIVRDFRPFVADLLVHGWQGSDVLVLGQGAFEWFGLGDVATKAAIVAHYSREDRFETSLDVEVRAPDGVSRVVRLHPLPHPSPLNATWAARFPAMMDARLKQTGYGPDTWRVQRG